MKIFLSLIFVWANFSNLEAKLSEDGFFSGRISKINKTISIIRLKVDFENVKYLNPKDKVEFWDEKNGLLKCKSFVVGRSADYVMLKVTDYSYCEKLILLTNGAFFKLYSEDLKNNILMGKEVLSILLKKRMAIKGQLESRNKDVLSHLERVEAINSRFQNLKTKLEEEWKKELYAIEEDKVFAIRAEKDLEKRLDEVDKKIELYKIRDENLKLDRWSLDSNLYFKK